MMAQTADGDPADHAMRKVVVACAVLALMGTGVLLFLTRNGVGVSPDSVAYIGAARNITSGRGVSLLQGDGTYKPLTHYPPLLPMILGGIGFCGPDPVNSVRWLNAIFFGANAFLVGLLIHRYSRSFGAAIGGAALFLVSGEMMIVHSHAWTEPSFIFLMLLGLALLQFHLEMPDRRFLVGAGVVTALAFLDRYVGAALVGAGLTGILLLRRGTRRERTADCLLFGAIGCLPMALWIVRNASVADTATNRTLAFHPIGLDRITEGLATAAGWALPARLPFALRAGLVLTVALGMTLLSARTLWKGVKKKAEARRAPWTPQMPHLVVLTILCYLMLLVVSISFADADSPMDERMLSPAFALAIVAAATCICWIFFRAKWSPAAKTAAGVALLLLFGGRYAWGAAHWATTRCADGAGYTAKAWKESEILRQAGKLPADVPIYSNASAIIYFLTGHAVYKIPTEVNPNSLQPAKTFDQELSKMQKDMHDRNGVFIVLDEIQWPWYLATEEKLVRNLRLRIIADVRDGRIYVAER